ncbi:MAG: SET domain-containing protein-lysine N-methyltransferase [Saprospiraceae bacterium]|nr:SET domain-containing protein-lysine N-methyltransferase [Saprospiraceae bacterium]
MLQIPGLYVAQTLTRGRGVFTGRSIEPGSVIEICEVIFIPEEQLPLLDQTILYEYYFLWPDDSKAACIALGLGSLYNHAPTPNAEVVFDLDETTLTIKSIQPIAAGSEICIDYQGGLRNAPELWF